MTSDNKAREHFAIDLAQRAGELGLRYFRDLDRLTIESKGHQDLVSKADREVELFIRAAIASAYPGRRHRRRGTCLGRRVDRLYLGDRSDRRHREFRARHSRLGVVIACVKDGDTVVGVIHEPSTGETFYGRRGRRCVPERQADQGKCRHQPDRRLGRHRLLQPRRAAQCRRG